MTPKELATALGGAEERADGFYALCPAHSDERPSLAITAHDGKLLFTCRVGCPQAVVLAALKARGLWPQKRNGNPSLARQRAQWSPILPVPAHAGPIPTSKGYKRKGATEWQNHPVVASWPYRDAEGRLLGFVCRIQLPGGKKDVVPLTWCRDDQGKERWAWQSFPKPRPLYGLDRLLKQPGTQVIIAEGEKTADAAQRLFANSVAVTWPGGSKAVKHADWEPLEGRRVAIFPDADVPGYRAALEIAAILKLIADGVRVVAPPPGVPEGWDVADADWTPAQAGEWARDNTLMPENFALRVGLATDGGNFPVAAVDVSGVPAVSASWAHGLLLNEKHVPRVLLANALLTLRRHPALCGMLSFDMFSQRLTIMREAPWGSRPGAIWSDRDDALLCEFLQHQEIRVGLETAAQAAQAVAAENEFDSLKDYLLNLRWDGQPRLAIVAGYFGVAPQSIGAKLARLWMISAVARGLRPGCKADHVLTLEGQQGLGKSTALRTLFDPVSRGWFRDELPSLDTKDAPLQLVGAWCVEIAELEAVNSRRSELERVKAFLSRLVDSYRPPYGRRAIDVPRRAVFAGSTNDATYLRDSTGNRRWWPLKCGAIDVDTLERDRNQLWAEAVAEFERGEPWWLDSAELAPALEREQEARRTLDPWEPLLADYLRGHSRVSVEELLIGPLDVNKGQWGQAHANRVARILQRAGFTRRQVRDGLKRPWVYERSVSPDGSLLMPTGDT